MICGVGDAADSGDVLGAAEALSRDLGAELVLVHVAEGGRPSSDRPPFPFDPATYRSGALEFGASFLQRQAGATLTAGARGRVELGDPAARLAEVAREERASLVVVGWRGRRFPRSSRLLNRLMRRCDCPVVVVRRAAGADDDRADRERIAPLADR